jgi:hypothetical protein
MSTYTYRINVGPEGATAIIDLVNAPNSPCEVIVQNLNGNGISVYLGNAAMYNDETWGLELRDGASLSIALGAYDDLWAVADDFTTINVLKTSGNRR